MSVIPARRPDTLRRLRRLGFDQSYNSQRAYAGFPAQYRAKCSQCEALVINGVPTHERGCINQRPEKKR